MDLNVYRIKPGSTNITTTTSSGSGSTNQSALPLVDAQKQELLRRLGITQEQYDAIIAKNPNFVNLTFDKQQEFVEAFKAENPVDVSTQSLESSQEGALVNNLPFDRLKFKDKETPIEDKLQTVAYELAKNQFMYGDPQNKKTEAQWAALTPEQQMEHINATIVKVNELLESKAEELKNADPKKQNILISKLMTAIQTANSQGMSLNDFAQSKDVEFREQSKYDYLSGVPEEELLFNERLFLNRNNLLKESVSHYLEHNNLSQDNLSLDNLRNIIEESDLTQIDMQYEYLLHKKENGDQLSLYETKQLEVLGQIYHSEVYKAGKNSGIEIPIVEECTISDLENTDIYSNADVSTKASMLLRNIKSVCGDNKTAIEAELKNCFNYAIQNSDYELAQQIASMMNRQGISVSETDNSAMTAARIFTIDVASAEDAVRFDYEVSGFENKEFANVTRRALRHHVGEHQMRAVSEIVTDDVQIANANFDMGTRAKDLDIARDVYSNLYSYATQETKNYVAANADKAQADENVQNYVLSMYTKDNAEATQAAINAKVVTRFDKRNQTEAFSTLKTNAETLMPESDAINALNSLSDQIQYCDKDNQLAMHETIMGSKYSEVQTHAAGNIKNYDASVQSKAIDAVYNSGNTDAIKTVVNDISSFKSVDVQQLEAIRDIGEALLLESTNSDENFLNDEKFLNGNLSYAEIKALPASERQQYIQNYFKKLPIEQKIKLISQIKDASMKKAIYVMIARTDSSLFAEICKDADRVANLLDMSLPDDVRFKIAGIVGFYAVSDLQFKQVAEKYKIDIGNNTYFADTEPKTANTFGYSSIPSGLGLEDPEKSLLRKGIGFSFNA